MGNGRRRATPLSLEPRRGLRRRSWVVAAGVITFVVVLGARRCKTLEPITEARRDQLRADVITGCAIHGCSPEQLRNLLNQVDAYPGAEEDDGR